MRIRNFGARAVVWLGVFATWLVLAPVVADTIPQCGDLCFHSADPAPVSVTLTHESQADRHMTLSVPRSAILFVPEYTPPKFQSIPDKVVSKGSSFAFGIVAPDGQPLGEAVEAYAKAHNTSLGDAITSLRPLYMRVRVWVIGKNLETDALWPSLRPRAEEYSKTVSLPDLDGLTTLSTEHYALRPNGTRDASLSAGPYIYFLPKDPDELFTAIRCPRTPSDIVWCDYGMRVDDLVGLRIHMVDFRRFGGGLFLRDRMKLIRRTYCTYAGNCPN